MLHRMLLELEASFPTHRTAGQTQTPDRNQILMLNKTGTWMLVGKVEDLPPWNFPDSLTLGIQLEIESLKRYSEYITAHNTQVLCTC